MYNPMNQSTFTQEPRKSFVVTFMQNIRVEFKNPRKRTALILVILVPTVGNLWQFIPDHFYFTYYDQLNIFVYTFTTQLTIVIFAIVWSLNTPPKDYLAQLMAAGMIVYGVFMTLSTLPFTIDTPLSVDLTMTAIVGAIIIAVIVKTHIRPGNNPKQVEDDYRQLIYDLNHSKLMGSVCRMEALLSYREISPEEKKLLLKELKQLRKTASFVNEKYT